MPDNQVLETVNGNAAIEPWHIGAHAVLTIGDNNNLRLQRKHMLDFIEFIESGQRGISLDCIFRYEHRGHSQDMVFRYELSRGGRWLGSHNLTIRINNVAATLTANGVERFLSVLKSTSSRGDNEWCEEMTIPDDMYSWVIGDWLMITAEFCDSYRDKSLIVGDKVQLVGIIGNNFAIQITPEIVTFTTAKIINSMRRMYLDSTGDDNIELDDVWDTW